MASVWLSCISPFLRRLRNQWPWISLRGHPRSSILVPIESAYSYSYKWSIGTWTLSCTVSEIRRLKCRKSTIFPPTPIPVKIWGCSLWSRSVMLGSVESEMVRLISCEIIFAEFQPISSRYLNVSPFLRHLTNQWLWISLRGHPRSSILVPIESAYTYSY